MNGGLQLRTRLRRRLALGLGLAGITIVVAAAGAPIGSGASSGTVVGATVPSATSIDATLCPPLLAGTTDFGVVMPGSSSVTTNDCIVDFGSSNDTAMLRVGQSDRAGRAMWQATNGGLDTSWRSPNGFTHGAGALLAGTGAHVVLDDGSIVVARSAGSWPTYHAAVQKYTPAGTLDPTFGSPNGWVQVAVNGGHPSQRFDAIAVQPDGKLVVAGRTHSGTDEDWLIARLNPDGSLDTAEFNAPLGYTTLGFGGLYETVNDVAVDSQGRIVLAGVSLGLGQATIARLLPNGSLDTAGFGAPVGYRQLHFGNSFNNATALALLPDDRIVWTGHVNSNDGRSIIARMTTIGTFDVTFAAPTGYRIFNFGIPGTDHTWANTITARDDGGWLVAGTYGPGGGDKEGFVAAYTADGAVDTTFGSGGYVLVDMGPDAWDNWRNDPLLSVIELKDGTIMASGLTWTASGYRPATVALNPNGSRVASHGINGVNLISPIGDASGARLHDLDDGAVLLVGGGNAGTYVARLGGTTILDYGAGGTWGSGANAFGACLRAVTAGATTNGSTWAVDANGNCSDGDADPWRAIPPTIGSAGSTIASAPLGTATARAQLRFGLRVALSQRPGRYVAPITFEVVAPAA
jgi:uncharacterized delta-60 repeat protein